MSKIEKHINQTMVRLDDIFKDKNLNSCVTYKDLFDVTQGMLDLVGYIKQKRDAELMEYTEEIRKCIDRIYDDMFKIAGFDNKH